MISTRDLSLLPVIDQLRWNFQSLAMLDAIVSPEWEYRCYSFNSRWALDESMGSMRNGCGDDLFVHFSPTGAWIKGFAHESSMSPYIQDPEHVWPGVLDRVPAAFAGCLSEPAFSANEVTFCIWRLYSDSAWQLGPVEFPVNDRDPDGSEYLLSLLDGQPETYQAWAQQNYSRELDLSAVQDIYLHKKLTPHLVGRLNSETSLAALSDDIDEIGYPS